MKLSKPQVQMFWRLWAAACRAQGWTPAQGVSREEIEERRKDLLSCYGFASLHDVDRRAGFDAIKAALLTLTDNVAGAVESEHPEIGETRRLRWHIQNRILPKLGSGAWAYMTAITEDRWGITRLDLDTLSRDQLSQLVMTLHERLKGASGTEPAASPSSISLP